MTPIQRKTFEVFGKVQGVFFRKHTKITADEIGITGWCMNTPTGSVTGEIEGTSDQLTRMTHWLGHVGSPNSTIERLTLGEMHNSHNRKYIDFQIIRKE